VTVGKSGVVAAVVAMTLFSFFVYPNHTYLQSDTQIYAPVLEWLEDPSLYPGDQIPSGAHISLTIYDEMARLLHPVTGSFESALQLQQLVFRACGILGIFLIAVSAGLTTIPALLVAGISSLGAAIAGPAILTVEYEPVPRGFSIGLTFLSLGLVLHQRYWLAGTAAAIAFLYHAPAVWPYYLIVLLLWRRREFFIPLGVAILVLATLAIPQTGIAERQKLFAVLSADQVAIQEVRASYVWVSAWFTKHVLFYLATLAVLFAADRRLKSILPGKLRISILVLTVVGVLTMPVSYLLLEKMHWALLPQLQPMRALLFPVQFAIILASIAAFTIRPLPVRALWLTVALVYPFLHGGQAPPRIENVQLIELSDWARQHTDRSAVFLFPDVGRTLPPGIFRARSLRSVYTDWKSGGQVNYFPNYAREWWKRWNEAILIPFSADRVPALAGMGIDYLVLTKSTLPESPVWSNSIYSVYQIRKEKVTDHGDSSKY